MRRIDEFFSPVADRDLYHYTGIGALLGMVESRTVWASHAYYLNDSQELLHGCDVLRRIATQELESAQGTSRHFLTQFVKWLGSFHEIPYHIYLFSLSEERSLLSQWRSYTPHGKGVSIGFSSKRLNVLLGQAGFRIAQCKYEQPAQEELVKVLLGHLLETFRQRSTELEAANEHPNNKYFSFLEEFRNDLLQVLSILKHPTFKEEKEWRLISPYFPKYTVPTIRFREGASMLVPYIELSLAAADDTEPLFKEIILGPSQYANLSMSALSNFLSNRGACNATSNSGIPYREW